MFADQFNSFLPCCFLLNFRLGFCPRAQPQGAFEPPSAIQVHFVSYADSARCVTSEWVRSKMADCRPAPWVKDPAIRDESRGCVAASQAAAPVTVEQIACTLARNDWDSPSHVATLSWPHDRVVRQSNPRKSRKLPICLIQACWLFPVTAVRSASRSFQTLRFECDRAPDGEAACYTQRIQFLRLAAQAVFHVGIARCGGCSSP